LDSVYWSSGEDLATLNEFGDWVTGSTPSTQNPDYFGGSIPFVTPPEIKDSKEVFSTKRTLTIEGGKKVRVIELPSIHLVCIGTVGKVGFSTGACATNQQITSLVPSAGVDFTYALDLLGTREATRRLRLASGQSNMPMLSKGALLKIEMPLPHIQEQLKRLGNAQTIKSKRHEIERRFIDVVEALNDLKQSILYSAFNGQLLKGN
jgi:type I restriction enzyme S subunit